MNQMNVKKMTKDDCFNCDFVEEYMYFYNILDFYEKSDYFKLKYKNLNKDQIHLYRWYVYANVNIDLETKNLIWEYLNSDIMEETIKYKEKLKKLYYITLRKYTKYEIM